MGSVNFENERLFVSLVENHGLNLFLGAGFSVYACNNKSETLPLGDAINQKLKEHFEITSQRQLSLGKTCRKIKSSSEGALQHFLRDTYSVTEFSDKYYQLALLPIKSIFTTNIDNLIERIYGTYGSNIGCCDMKLNGYIEKNNLVNLYKLHGSVSYPIDMRLSFTEEELQDLFIVDSALFDAVSFKLTSGVSIFWGSKVIDSNTIQLLARENRISGKAKLPKWVVVFPQEENLEEVIEEYHDRGFFVIVADTIDLLNYLSGMSFVKKKEPPTDIYKKYRDAFPANFICNELKKSVIVRPIADFFSGAEPQISDILSGSIERTSYYGLAYELISRHKTSLITGIPGCGKTALMLQLALSDEIKGRKFWFDNIIEIEAERLVELTREDDNVVVFIDNLYSNLSAFNKLCKNKNIKVVTAERTFNYEFVRSYLNINANAVIDISDLLPTDIQKICNSINKPNANALTIMKKNKNVSLLEIVFHIYHSISIKDKISQYINDLTKYSDSKLKINLLELYALVNYVSYCGVPISMDMLMFYFSNVIDNYDDIYYAFNKFSNILVDAEVYENNNVSQDFYTVRSKLYAQLTISKLPKKIMQKVLYDFWKNVSPSMIYRYDIFKKKAYDADITKRVFNLKDGMNFYNQILINNQSHYVRQQYALFLQRKDDIDGAWHQIDLANTECRGTVFSIANTHAIIMFEKNITVNPTNAEDTAKLKSIINRSFETLESCIEKDLRVNYHVLVYSKNTVRYYEKFGIDNNTEHYFENSLKHLKKILDSEEFIYRSLRDELKSYYYQIQKHAKQLQ